MFCQGGQYGGHSRKAEFEIAQNPLHVFGSRGTHGYIALEVILLDPLAHPGVIRPVPAFARVVQYLLLDINPLAVLLDQHIRLNRRMGQPSSVAKTTPLSVRRKMA
ncbi:MAG: hypothetical protein KatS3mg045_1301 [Bellilinea sp.]|nr:MAG: hypothetical protein KatS3mg045_1301 [Bellilinea sp.]